MRILIGQMHADGTLYENTRDALRDSTRVVLQTNLDGNVSLPGASFESLDALFENAADFNSLLGQAVDTLFQDGTMLVTLGDIYQNEIAHALLHRAHELNADVTILGNNTALNCACERGLVLSACPIFTCSASSLSRIYDTDALVVINEIDAQVKASDLKLVLADCYGDEYTVLLVNTANGTSEPIPLHALDTQPDYGYYTTVVIPPQPLQSKTRYTFADLVRVMDRLRAPGGCPWDREQTHESLKRFLVEESYEVLEAIDDGDTEALFDELGDVLLQVVFHAKVGQQRAEFDITDVTTAICTKMISRHTHIFGSATAETPDAVIKNWEQIKRAEKGQQSQTEVLRHIPKSMPALMRGGKVQSKAAHVGFDFREPAEAILKLREEIGEVESDLRNGQDMWEECGDLLFAAANVARLCGVEPEIALQKATDKFISRFAAVEEIAAAQKLDMHTCSLEKLDEIWALAKKNSKTS